MSKVKITIDGMEIMAEGGSNLLEAARRNGFKIPSFCHDPRLEAYGACRQCLVEVEGARGVVQACGAEVREGMVVRTNTENIIGLRRLGLELLLTEHCGDCIAPCQLACPARIDIQGFVAHIANGKDKEAVKLIREKLPLPASIGRVCPRFCEKDCRRNLIDGPVSICFLKRYAGDAGQTEGETYTPLVKPDTGKKAAVVGGGPAGLTAAYFLALEGHSVTIFEAAPQLGGMMRYGIPEYRLPKAVLDQEIKVITDLCQDVFCNKALGRDFTIEQLKQMGFDAAFIGIGSWANQSLNLPGEELEGVYSGIHFLGGIALNRPLTVGKKVVVIGGGNTSMDAARTSVRLGAPEVTVVYRRSREEMPANPHEISQAEEEGVKFELLTAPVEFISNDAGKVQAIRCVKMQLGEPDKSGRRRPIPLPGSEFEIPVDMVITATGQKLDKSSVTGSPELTLNQWGDIDTNTQTMQCGTEWLFSGGDCVTGPATAVEAIAAGRKAAISMEQYLKGESVIPVEEPFNSTRGPNDDIDPAEFADRERIPRAAMPTVAPEARKDNFQEFELGFTEQMARRESERCLSCGCLDVFTCRLREYATDTQVRPERLGFGKMQYPILNDHPYIVRDPNKCVLCGNCVRVCQEIQGVGALGFVNRGSQTVVLPSLKSPLSETLCKSCGQCVAICPTGALTRRSLLAKPGPWPSDKVDSVCPYCNIGCKLEINVVGDQIIGITSPVSDQTVNQGDLCVKGFFGYNSVQNRERLRMPLIRKDEELREVSWEDALSEAGNIIKEIKDNSGPESLAVAVSPSLTTEENYLAHQLGLALGSSNIFGTVPVSTSKNALEANHGVSSSSFEDLLGSDLIIVFGRDISENYPIAAHKIKKAVAKGSKLLIVSSEVTSLQHLARYTLKINHNKISKLLETFISYVLRYNLVSNKVIWENPSLIEELKNRLHEDYYDMIGTFLIKPEKIIEFFHYYLRAKNPVIVVDGCLIAPEELELLSALNLITGNPRQRRGLMTLYPGGNVNSQLNMGIKADIREHRNIIEGMKSGKIKGLLIIEDRPEFDSQLFQNGVKTIGITPYLPIWHKFDVVLPGSAFAETTGSYTNCEGRKQQLSQALVPWSGKTNSTVIKELAQVLGYQWDVKGDCWRWGK